MPFFRMRLRFILSHKYISFEGKKGSGRTTNPLLHIIFLSMLMVCMFSVFIEAEAFGGVIKFQEDFESGDLGLWTSTKQTAGTLIELSSVRAAEGASSVRVAYQGSVDAEAWLRKVLAEDLGGFCLRFKIYLDEDLSMASDGEIFIINALGQATGP